MARTIIFGQFEWDEEKERQNISKHKVDFQTAARAFLDPNRVIAQDEKHSAREPRLFCLGMVDHTVITVRLTKRRHRIRIIGAGIWRKESKFYGKTNQEN